MKITDFVYGAFNIEEPVFKDLIASPYMQRLKSISTGGYYPGGYPELQEEKRLNRFDHSIGVWLLLKKFNAPLEEQIAGLLHDISHSAFSHTIDYIESASKDKQKTHSGQDDEHEEFIIKTDIPEILAKHNFDLNYILDDKNFPLKENNLPDICADRIDYSLRHMLIYSYLSPKEVHQILKSLTIHNGSFVFSDASSCQIFTEGFWKLDSEQYSAIKTAIAFCYNGKLLREMIVKGYLTKNDLFEKNDKEIIKLFEEKSKTDNDVRVLLNTLNLPISAFQSQDKEGAEHLFVKIRRVDPVILVNENKTKRYSEVNPEYHEKLKSVGKFSEYFLQHQNIER